MAKRYAYPLSLVVVTALLIGFVFQADAGFLFFSNRDSWQAALGGANGDLLNFNTFTVRTSFADNAINFGPFTLSSLGTPPVGANAIEVPPFDDVNDPSLDRTPYASMFLDSTRSVALRFNNPVTAFAGDFAGGGLTNFGVFTFNQRGANYIPGPPSADKQFFGFISTDAFNRIDFQFNGPQGGSSVLALDNARFAPTAVPEPGSLLLMGMGATLLAGYGCWNTRRKRDAHVKA